jgi:hypothetical protein
MQCTLNKCHSDVYMYWLRSEKKANIDIEAPYCLWAKPTITKQKALFTIYWTYNGKICMSACFEHIS